MPGPCHEAALGFPVPPVAEWTAGIVATSASAQSAPALLDELCAEAPFPIRTYARWKAGEQGRIDRDTRARLSNLMGIHKALRIIFHEAERGYRWIRAANDGFGGRSALGARRGAWRRTDRPHACAAAARGGARRLVIDRGAVPVTQVAWARARRIIRSLYPPVDLFEDIADPEDWPLLISAERKTNPRLMETIDNLDLVPAMRRVGGPGASYLMAPFTHVGFDRPSRFTNGAYGVLHAADRFETALAETIHHHERFMARTAEPEGWTSQFREIALDVGLHAHDPRGDAALFGEAPTPDNYAESQALAADLRAAGSDGIAYPSRRQPGGACVALFYPDLAANPVQVRHLDYHWDGARVDLYREVGGGAVYRIEAEA